MLDLEGLAINKIFTYMCISVILCNLPVSLTYLRKDSSWTGLIVNRSVVCNGKWCHFRFRSFSSVTLKQIVNPMCSQVVLHVGVEGNIGGKSRNLNAWSCSRFVCNKQIVQGSISHRIVADNGKFSVSRAPSGTRARNNKKY